MKIKALVPILLIALVVLVVVLDAQRRQAQKELKNLTVRLEQLQGNDQANQLVVVLDAQRRQAQKELKNLTVRLEQLQGNDQANQEKAKAVVERVKILMDIDTSVEPTVATIVDVAKLQERNPFYNKAQNGDYLIVTPSRAILYRESINRILDVVPVQIENPAPVEGNVTPPATKPAVNRPAATPPAATAPAAAGQ